MRAFVTVALVGVLSAAAIAEDDSAADLPVRDGLEIWFDASAITIKAAEPTETSSEEGTSLETWPDRSGNERHLSQKVQEARPQLIKVGKSHVVRFDGIDDHLRSVGSGHEVEAATIFLVGSPQKNSGSFRAFLAANAKDRNDFQSGFTIDQGGGATLAFNHLNVEGQGFGGAQNLMRSVTPFGTLHVFDVTISPKTRLVTLFDDGEAAGTRPFEPAPLSLDELTVGARHYGFGKIETQGWMTGDIAEILIYGRELSDDEKGRVREYLAAKHADLKLDLPGSITQEGIRLESIADPPPVQMFVPGFLVKELPVTLPNINNVRYRPDGKLVALAYNGDVYLLEDTDGDGLEDKAATFWENEGRIRSPIGMALTPPGYERGEGLFVATKSECILITDTDGDDKADTETTVAKGWSESFHNVDALGVAVDPKDHSVYFGLGTANFADPYLRDKEGDVGYSIDGERSTILRVSPDFSTREVYCTGIRFPVALAFNREGDLFATDQEGATWVPNGNPLDELLHIQKGRHYGFPPRHPKLLPDVIDEPSTFDYSPQHQSTCGLTFNDPVVMDGPTFGPDFWASDAFVCGYSRGKVWRSKLVKTPAGYVVGTQLIASLDMLTVDSCIAPQGELVIAVHSGGPDWGSGPSGEGKLYKVAYENREAPQPVATWAAGPDEVRIAFDRPLELEQLQGLASATRITYGEFVRAGDEYEAVRPGYEVVARQMTTPRFELKVHGAQVTPDRRTLILTTDSQRQATWHAIRLPGMGRPDFGEGGAADEGETAAGAALSQYPTVDLDYTLDGVAATWEGDGSTWSGWLPHPDLAVSRQLTLHSAMHEELWDRLTQPGTLRLRTQFDLKNMLQPVTQPGSKLDYEPKPETVTLHFTASIPFRLRTAAGETTAKKDANRFTATIVHGPSDDTLLPVTIELDATGGDPALAVTWTTAGDDRSRPLPLHRLLLPWAKPKGTSLEESLEERVIPELADGSWARGRKVFFGEQALCSRCHAVHGEGGTTGPDLSNLVHRDYASVLRDVTEPSYAINPDYVTHSLALADGRVFTGTLRTAGDRLLINDSEGKSTPIDRDQIEESVPSAKSIMPEGLPQRIGDEAIRDLLTFLLKKPPHMPLAGGVEPPPARPIEELKTVLAGAPTPPEPIRPIKVVLVAGNKDHGPGEHDYPAWQKSWQELLAAGEQVEVGTAWAWPSADDFATADVLVFYQQGTWTPERAKDIDAYLKRGGGLVYIHYAVDGGADAPGFAQRIGLAWKGGGSKFRHGPLDLGFEAGAGHPIARNFSMVKFVDESYWQLVGDTSKVRLLATGVEDGQPQPLFWTYEPSKGRVFVSIPGHFSWTFDDPLFRVLLLRGIAWSAREPVDRFNDLTTIGARVGK
ncbi:MAG: ThuA domain-containing protein [Planctomycetaceae bacterium]|nr:ThuA domain-containing protein [Planctomycetaceae bacterium]